MEKVKIPTKVLLDAMLQQLKLANAVYSTCKARTVGLDTTIEFYPSDHQLKKGLPKKLMTIYVYGKPEEAEDVLHLRLSNTWRPPTAKTTRLQL